MAFSVVESPVRTVWMPLDSSSTYYRGQIVSLVGATKAQVAGGAIIPLTAADDVSDTHGFQIPFGVILGFNDRTPVYGATVYAGLEKCVGIITQADQIARLNTGIVGAEGMYAKNDPQPLAQVAVIGPNTVLRGPIYNAAYGTACTAVADTAGTDTTGYTTAGTTATSPFTPVANNCTIYCRTGANMGLYRVTNDTSATAPDTTVAFPYDVALGDTFVRVPFKVGLSFIQINAALYVDQATGAGTNYFETCVWKMDLSTSGREYVDFSFLSTHFGYARA